MNDTISQLFQANRQVLHQLMQQAGISSYDELIGVSGVSGWQLSRLQFGLMPKMPIETLLKLSETLKVPIDRLITLFYPQPPTLLPCEGGSPTSDTTTLEELAQLKQEYRYLQQQLEQQRETLEQEFQCSSLATLESWLLQWPTAVAAAKSNPQLSAVQLLPLLKPVMELLKRWGVEPIGKVGESMAYDPLCHQLLEGSIEPGETVKVRYVGYRQGDKLLYRAQVSPIVPKTPSETL